MDFGPNVRVYTAETVEQMLLFLQDVPMKWGVPLADALRNRTVAPPCGAENLPVKGED